MDEFNMIKVISPLHITLSKKEGAKKYHLNMNNYRNWHYQVSNNLKKKYKEIISWQIEGKKFTVANMEYRLFYPDKRRRDKMNVIAVIDKFFMDALVESGCIEDDNDKYVGEVLIRVPEIDRDNPRCEINIYFKK
jgi:CRISPR/Cas system endoribonuclease Cas6 (RAMP superfamily)